MKTNKYHIFFNYFRGLLLLILFGLLFTPLNAQKNQKKQLTPKDFDLWETIVSHKLSNNGEWLAYAMEYANGSDTLFVKNIQNGFVHTIADALRFNYTFSVEDDYLAFSLKKGGNGYLDLNKGIQTIVPENIWQFFKNNTEFTVNGKYLTSFKKNDKEGAFGNLLSVKNLLNGKTIEIENVLEYSFNKTGNQFAYIAQNHTNHFLGLVRLINGKETKKIICSNQKSTYNNLKWDNEGRTFAFLEAFRDSNHIETNHIVHQYRNDSLYSFDPQKSKEFPKGMYIKKSNEFLISNDGQRIFFESGTWSSSEIDENNETSDNKTVQIWHWKDREVYPHLRNISKSKSSFLSVWNSNLNSFKQIENKEQSKSFLSGDHRYAFSYNSHQYRPFFKYLDDYIDIYITNLQTGKKELFLKKQKKSSVITSPEGKYVSYFKDKDWWVYNIKTKVHTNVTKSLPYQVYQAYNENDMKLHTRSTEPFGPPLWSKDDKYIVIQDKYDFWLIELDGTSHKKLTNGRAKKIRHKIYEGEYTIFPIIFGHEGHNVNLKDGLLFSLFGETSKKSGYASWNNIKGYRQIVYTDKHIDQLRKAKNKEIYVIQEQRFDMPPELVMYSVKNKGNQSIVQSNKHHQQYQWGKSELIEYKGINGETLQGALFYPANYQIGKKYPMIVDIYELRSHEVHHYINPSSLGYDENYTNFTLNDYFVLLPDIIYKSNEPGISATKCVVSAVEQVLKTGMIDKKGIGLIGHSFGGYETSFIITQTDLFSAAVAGAAAKTDILSSYLSFYYGDSSETEYVERAQPRFTGSFWDYKEAYLRNSPIHNLEKVNTPLLTWFGDKDPRVNISQGIEMYNAMRRLEKENVFLVYPDESHSLNKSKNQEDLSNKIMHWFDHKLKGVPPQDWIVNGEFAK